MIKISTSKSLVEMGFASKDEAGVADGSTASAGSGAEAKSNNPQGKSTTKNPPYFQRMAIGLTAFLLAAVGSGRSARASAFAAAKPVAGAASPAGPRFGSPEPRAFINSKALRPSATKAKSDSLFLAAARYHIGPTTPLATIVRALEAGDNEADWLLSIRFPKRLAKSLGLIDGRRLIGGGGASRTRNELLIGLIFGNVAGADISTLNKLTWMIENAPRATAARLDWARLKGKNAEMAIDEWLMEFENDVRLHSNYIKFEDGGGAA